MSSIFQRLAALGSIATVALAVAACGSSSSSSTSKTASTSSSTTVASKATTSSATSSAPATVIGRSTSLVINPLFTAALKKEAITVKPVAPATEKKTVLVFPATGGQIVAATLTGTIDHTGGLTFSHSGKTLTATDFVINTSTKQITAKLAGQSVPIFDLNLASLKRASGPRGTIVATNVKLTVTANAASALNSSLGVSTFKGGQNFGIATLTVAVKS